MRLIAVVQARMGSTRLPGKSLMPVWRDMPLAEMVLRRVRHASAVHGVVLATSESRDCDPLADLARGLGVAVVRGSEDDVLSRFALAVSRHPCDAVARVCADNPLVASDAIDSLAACFAAADLDYASNASPAQGLPDGLGAEIIRADALLLLHRVCAEPRHREHVTAGIVDAPASWRIGLPEAPPALRFPQGKLDVDTAEDLRRMRDLLAALPAQDGPLWSSAQIVNHLRREAA